MKSTHRGDRRAGARALAVAVACSAASLATAAPRAAAAQAATSARDAARAAFDRGIEALTAGRLEQAARELEASERLRPLPVVRYNLALAYRGLGRNADALALFERYIAQPEADAQPARLDAVRREIERLARVTARLALRLAPSGAVTVRVDGGPPRAAPEVLVLEAGPHALDFAAPGRAPAQRRVVLAQGASQRLEIELAPDAAVGVGAATAPQVAPAPAARGISPLVWVGGGVALAGAVVAVALFADGNALEEDYRSGRCARAERPGTCDLASTQAQLDTRTGVINGAWVVAGAGVALAGVGMVLSLVQPAQSATRDGARGAPRVQATLSGLRVTW